MTLADEVSFLATLTPAEHEELLTAAFDQVWTLARTKVMRLGYDEKPFSIYDGGIDSDTVKRCALAELTAVEMLRVALAGAEELAAHQARRHGASFTEMADAVGISRQAARKRFAGFPAG